TMNLYLPQISSDAPSEKEPAIQDEPARGSAHLLLVDDEEFVLDSASQLLEMSGYKVSICRNGREAVTYYKENWRAIDLVMLDMVMPEMGGRETFAEMKKVNPQIRALLSTGYSINGEARQILDEGVMEFIQKPYRRIEIVEKIADILKKV
ncbi:MAG: response regulator, partial [Proteobacteria bacterium]|nr:response regulator [Pseudomonadota bacterium]